MTLRPLCLLSAVLLGVSGLVFAQNTPPTPPAAAKPEVKVDNGTVHIRTGDLDIDSFLGLLEMLTGKSIIRPATLPATTYALNLTKAIPKEEAILAVESVLGLNGLGVVPMGDKFLKVVALAQAPKEAPQMIEGSTLSLPPSGRIAAKFFQFEHARITEVQAQILNLMSVGVGQTGATFFDKANAALITDTISNLQRIETLIQSFDRPMATPKFYTLKFAKASELVQKVQAIMQSAQLQTQFASTTTITADDRTNQIVLVTEPKRHDFFDEMITKLDVKADPNTRTEVVYLKHANSTEVATLLTSLISGQTAASQRAGATQLIQRAIIQGARQQAAQNPQQAQAVQAATAAALAGQQAASMGSNSFSSIITVLADERTNSIVVNGTMDDLRLIRELIDKVDIILPQVRIEVVIAEVTLTDNDTTGIAAMGLQVDGNKLVGVSGSLPGATLGGSFDSDGNPASHATINRPGTGGYTLSGLIQLKATPRKSNTNILMVPSIITTHNKKAMFTVSTNYPTISSYLNDTASTGTGSSVGTGYRSTVGETKVGTTLEVTPLIGDDGSIQMEIKQEVSDKVGSTTIDGNEQPIVGERTTESFVTVRSGEIIVLGGLQRNTNSTNRSRLGPIPFLGDLLGSRTKEINRTDLVFFVRPVILTNTSEDNKDYLRRLETNPNKGEVQKALDPSLQDSEKEAVPAKQPAVRRRK